MRVTEIFLSLDVADTARAERFWVDAFGAQIAWTSPRWTSLRIAGARLALAVVEPPPSGERRTGLHVAVSDLGEACARVRRAGGRVIDEGTEVAPGVVVGSFADLDGNVIALTRAGR